MMLFVRSPAAWFLVLLSAVTMAPKNTYALESSIISDIFRSYHADAHQLDEMECRDDLEDVLCPPVEEEHIPCTGLDAVELYCRKLLLLLLGDDEVQSDAAAFASALEGCKNYVSWDDDRLNCCPSDACFEVTGEDEWGEWELVDEDQVEEDEDLEYEYADVLYDEDFGSNWHDEDEDEDDEYYHHREEDDDNDDDDDLLPPATRSTRSNATLEEEGGEHDHDQDLRKIPFARIPIAGTTNA